MQRRVDWYALVKHSVAEKILQKPKEILVMCHEDVEFPSHEHSYLSSTILVPTIYQT